MLRADGFGPHFMKVFGFIRYIVPAARVAKPSLAKTGGPDTVQSQPALTIETCL